MHYGVYCTDCGEAVEYADITSHPCSDIIRRKARLRELQKGERPTPRRFDPYWHHRDKETSR